jgi:signal transduction histidine kinase
MNYDSAVAAEVNALVSEWRGKAMTVVMALLAAIGLPALLLSTFSPGFQWPVTGRGAGALAVLAALLAVWRRDWSLPKRAGLFFVVVYTLVVFQLATTGLAGSGRLGLLVFPLLALILVGSWAGWVAFGGSLLIVGVFITLAAQGMLAGRLIVQDNSTDPVFWVVQGILWLALLAPLLALLSRFQTLQLRLMIEERQARRENEIAERERRRLEEEITQISDDERRRLGAELHDGLCQQLTAALLSCTALENELLARDLPQGPVARRVRRQLEESIGLAYDVAKGLCPVDLDPESLLPALQRLQAQAQKTPGVICELHADGDTSSLKPQATHHLYRIAQEAVHNALKHARCRGLTLELRNDDDGLLIRVQDDGQAAPPAGTARPGGLGTQIMHYRAKAIGGELRIERPDGGGTVVSCWVPSRAAAAVAADLLRG